MTDGEIISRHLDLFDLGGVTTSQMNYGFQGIGPGWLDIMEHLCTRLLVIAGPEFRVTSVKEKMGSLRISYRGGNDAVELAVKAARAEALVTCMSCGSPGLLREREGLWALQCERCVAE